MGFRKTPNSEDVKINIIGGSQFGRYNKISPERTWNMFISTAGNPEGDDYEQFLVNFPGYHRATNIPAAANPVPVATTPNFVPTGKGRGIFKSTRGSFVITVINSQVFKVAANGTGFITTLVGTLNTSENEVFIAENLNAQICIVDGTDAWIYNYAIGNTFTRQTNGALGSGDLVPNYVEYHNTFFLFGNANTTAAGAAWYAYSYSSATTIVQTTQLALQTKSDFALAIKKLPGQGNNVLVFGSTVCEIHTQVGGLQNYVRNPSRNINYGCLSVTTIGDSGDIVAWLAINEEEAPVIMMFDGNSASRISTDGIDYLLSTLEHPEISTAVLYRLDGHLLYQLTFYHVDDNLTLLYDFNTKLFFNLADQYFNYHPARGVAYYNGRTYFISLNNAALYEINSDFTYIDENLPVTSSSSIYDQTWAYEIPRERITSSIRQANSTRFRVNSLVMTLEQGTDPFYTGAPLTDNLIITEDGFVSDPDDDIITETGNTMSLEDSGLDSITPAGPYTADIPYIPRIDLAISNDGGITWSNYNPRELHQLGNRQNILTWGNMGVANDLCFKFRYIGLYRFIVNNGLAQVVSV